MEFISFITNDEGFNTITLCINIITLIVVVGGFYFTYKSVKRSAIIAEASHYHHAIEFQKDTWTSFFLGDSDDNTQLLKWHLNGRGIEDKGVLENKKILFILFRFDVYEELLLSHKNGLLGDDQISGWINAIKRDFRQNKLFKEVWVKVSKYYSPELNRLYQTVVAE